MGAEGKLSVEIKSLKKQDITDFHENEKKTQRKLSIQIIRHLKKDTTALKENKTDEDEKTELDLKLIPREDDPTTIVDIRDFKKNLPVYPLIGNDGLFENMDNFYH